MENTVPNPFQEWVNKHKPKKVKVKSEPREVLPELSPEDELIEAWEDWKRENRLIINAGIFLVISVACVTVLAALAFIDVSNGCFMTGVC